ncbi:vanadium-dependent haloperoxidase [Vibrio agarivorans]|uniref:Vanadium-dependent haloperoxidase n=1 Tax=Vibrio agarivorans TaxID=153622 RepID=A0ABT7XYV6_9VIBR|nr:vanadium-dependent haloperoxidase [Vibrio agarivorans]MDN2480970.1 vanadium-dependent haloperoxidase [Vibrio agarivorans]
MSDTEKRKEEAKKVRMDAAERAFNRPHPEHKSNHNGDDEDQHHYMMNFSKGLHHNQETGLVEDTTKFKKFRKAIDDGLVDAFTSQGIASEKKSPGRKWEAPTAGYVFSLQGPDAQAVTMPPAPALGTVELAYEMAEVYELALLRDVSLKGFSSDSTAPELADSICRLNSICYPLTGGDRNYQIGHPSVEGYEKDRPRTNKDGVIDAQNAYRGSSPGVEVGPYLSQFMLIGNNSLNGDGAPNDGLILFGAQQISQKVPEAHKGQDYMTDWRDWLDAQNGQTEQDTSSLYTSNTRFITTPRDLASYVHHDALYQAYLNALLIMLAKGTSFDPAFKTLSGQGPNTKDYQAGGFALWGGPHILSLVTEVATRALKAVRWQKFNTHLRLRPEVLAARIHKAETLDTKFSLSGEESFKSMRAKIQETVKQIEEKNSSGSALLPMAFQEGSPMHPSYGAGHATVAGACVTILKAFFDGSQPFDATGHGANTAYVASDDGSTLDKVSVVGGNLTVNGELNKLAANISIGRNMAGVHFYSDYFDSLRMGEAIAIGILEEQALCYPKDEFTLTLETFDGDNLTIHRSGVF